jgi:hypothetical protein
LSKSPIGPRHNSDGGSVLVAPEFKDAVREQMERLLTSPLLSQSHRYSSLLRYVVETTLSGEADNLKERTVGVEVFGREPAYDTSADPVVRTTAAQLRRRIAQYYFAPGHESEIVIELPAGGYTPAFHFPQSLPASRGTAIAEHELVEQLIQAPPSPSRRRRPVGHRIWVISVVAVLLAACALITYRATMPRSALEKFWQPVWDTPGLILVCVGTPGQSGTALGDSVPQAPTIRQYLAANAIAWPDAITFSSVVGLIQAHGHSYQLKKSATTVFSDLRNSPVVLIGGFNNQWIMRLGAPLRFHYVTGGKIEDGQNPSRRDWVTNFDAPFSTFDQDYGIITRVVDPSTERVLVVASGIAAYGTIAAGEFLTSEKYMRMIAERAPAGWERGNLQVVFSTRVINGNSGPPRILATHFWK